VIGTGQVRGSQQSRSPTPKACETTDTTCTKVPRAFTGFQGSSPTSDSLGSEIDTGYTVRLGNAIQNGFQGVDAFSSRDVHDSGAGKNTRRMHDSRNHRRHGPLTTSLKVAGQSRRKAAISTLYEPFSLCRRWKTPMWLRIEVRRIRVDNCLVVVVRWGPLTSPLARGADPSVQRRANLEELGIWEGQSSVVRDCRCVFPSCDIHPRDVMLTLLCSVLLN